MVVTIKTCVCGTDFEAQRSTAKYCSKRCRDRASRAGTTRTSKSARKPSPKPSPKSRTAAKQTRATGSNRGGRSSSAAGTGKPSDLEAAVRKELRAAGALDTVDGQIAILLAKQAAAPNASGLSSTVAKMREFLDRALGAASPSGPTGSDGDAGDDEVEQARKRRESKGRAASAR